MKCSSQTFAYLGLLMITLSGCASHRTEFALEEMEAFSLCQSDSQGKAIEDKVGAEYGFKRIAGDAYRPVVTQHLFGHIVRVVEMTPNSNKVYAAGEPIEFGYGFRYFLPEIMCVKDSCQAPLSNGQSLFIYKAKTQKSKDTTVIECTKPDSE